MRPDACARVVSTHYLVHCTERHRAAALACVELDGARNARGEGGLRLGDLVQNAPPHGQRMRCRRPRIHHVLRLFMRCRREKPLQHFLAHAQLVFSIAVEADEAHIDVHCLAQRV